MCHLNSLVGLYIPANCVDVPQEFRGIGIRIEDDVLSTSNGAEVLTKDCIKEVADFKKLFSNWIWTQRRAIHFMYDMFWEQFL